MTKITRDTYVKFAEDYPIPKEPAFKKSEEEYKKDLDQQSYNVLRNHGTERPWTSEYNKDYSTGLYKCKACGNDLFDASTKFDSGCGWPAFNAPVGDEKSVLFRRDTSHGMDRTEVICSNCHSHLGHVFTDGYKQDTGLRYCINGVCLVKK
ncbi:msrB [Acrasis kona]|uniref:Peptide-methionine (R)-S-oxide reductase n=1 Tax=Acrasis kona TaxID=1008807 RepID=A0AAW2YJ21_9EUKA